MQCQHIKQQTQPERQCLPGTLRDAHGLVSPITWLPAITHHKTKPLILRTKSLSCLPEWTGPHSVLHTQRWHSEPTLALLLQGWRCSAMFQPLSGPVWQAFRREGRLWQRGKGPKQHFWFHSWHQCVISCWSLPNCEVCRDLRGLIVQSQPFKYEVLICERSDSVKSLSQCLTLCYPMDCSPQASSVRGILRARILEWAAIPFSRGSFQHRDQTHVSRIAGSFTCFFNLCIHVFIPVFDRYWLSISSVPGTVLETGNMWTGGEQDWYIPVVTLLEGETLNQGAECFKEGEAMGALCMWQGDCAQSKEARIHPPQGMKV